MRGIAILTIFTLLISACGVAQTSAPSEEQTIRQLTQQIEELQQRVKALEAKASEGASAIPDANENKLADLQTEKSAEEQASVLLKDIHQVHGIQWHGFGEVNYKVLDQKTPELGVDGFVPGSAGGFYTGDLDLLLTSEITEKSSFLAEMVIGEGDAQSFDVDLDRVLFKYDYNDHLRTSFGRYHTGIGYYNQAFHSGKWLQTTADRPLIMSFADDGGILPTQAVGVSLTGAVPSKGWGLNYVLEYGSSDTIRSAIDGSGRLIDENNGNHINVGFFFRPGAAPGLQIGGSVFHDQISDFDRGPSVRLGQTILNGHIVYVANKWELLNEGFLIRHVYEQSPLVFNMPAFYTQLSRRIGKVRPFFRYQYINANPNSIFSDVSRREGPSFGARYDFDEFVGFKLQLDHTLRTDKPAINGLNTQLVFAF